MKEKGRLARLLSESFAFGLVGYRFLKPKTRESISEPPRLHRQTTQWARLARPAPSETQRASPSKACVGSSHKYQLISKAVTRFLGDDCTTMAAALAYYTTFSIAPLLLIIISIVGLVFGREAVQNEIQTQTCAEPRCWDDIRRPPRFIHGLPLMRSSRCYCNNPASLMMDAPSPSFRWSEILLAAGGGELSDALPLANAWDPNCRSHAHPTDSCTHCPRDICCEHHGFEALKFRFTPW